MAMNGGNVDSLNSGTLVIGNGATLTRTAGIVNTPINLRKNFSGGASPNSPLAVFVFPVGTSTGYSPVTANATAGSTGSLTVKAVNGLAPSTPALNAATTLNRHWQMTETGTLTADMTFLYLQTDVAGTEANYVMIRSTTGAVPRRFANVAPCPGAGSPCVDTTANTIFAAGVESFENFWTAGEPLAPTAANVTVSGRVFAEGMGLRNAIVTITGPTGVLRSARTNSFGYYRFDVEVGRTYVISVGAKQYQFTPRTISVTDELADIDFIAN
jgi:hypothetical protein